MCLINAKVYHTNEVLVSLGQDYFVERSQVQARGIAQRRIEFIQRNLEKMKADKERIEKRISTG